MARRGALLLSTAVLAAGGILPLPGQYGEHVELRAADVGYTGGWGYIPEKERLAKRAQAGYKWEFPGESPAYKARQEERWVEIMALDHYQERLDNFVQYTQVRTVPNYTQNGFDVVDVPPEIHKRMRDRLHAQLPKAREEGDVQGIYGDLRPQMVQHGERNLLNDLLPTMEAWVPEIKSGLQPVTAYGMRAYRRGASLGFHTDRVDTHIISAIVHVDHVYDNDDEPWPIEIEGHDGKRHAVDLKPGQMLLYESAKCPHGRSTTLKGDWYASVFVHFKPKDMATYWPYSQKDVWVAVPPGWNAKPLSDHGAGARWAGAFLTHDSVVVDGMAARPPPEPPKGGLPNRVKKLLEHQPAPAPAAGKRQAAAAKRAPPLDPELLAKAKAAAEAASDAPPDEPPSKGATVAARAREAFGDGIAKAAKKAGAAKASLTPFDNEKAERALENDDDDASAEDLPLVDGDSDAAAALKRDDKRRELRRRRPVASARKGGAKAAAAARSAVAKMRERKKKQHRHRKAPVKTPAEHAAAKARHRSAGRDDDDDDDGDDDDDEPEARAVDDDDDDEVEEVVGGAIALAGIMWWVGGVAGLSACSLGLRRALLTRGRSLTRTGKEKVDAEDKC